MGVKITDRETPEGKRFMAELADLAGLEVFVGYQRGEKQSEDGHDLVDIAAWNELGTSRGIPERPFLRQTIDKNQDAIWDAMDAIPGHIENGMDGKTLCNALGEMVVGMVQEEIPTGNFAPNAPSTLGHTRISDGKYIKRKKSDVPLIDTGQLRQSVHHVVRKKEQG